MRIAGQARSWRSQVEPQKPNKPCAGWVYSSTAQLGSAKIALALLLLMIFFKNHSRRVYISLVPNGDILETLRIQKDDTLNLIANLKPEQGTSRYAPEKWSLKEVLGHMIDSERIFAYRALRISRADQTPLPGFEQDDYVKNSNFDLRPLTQIAKEYEHIRWATLHLFEPLGEEQWSRRGTANNKPVSVRALAWTLAGHELHHKEIIRKKYLP